MLTHSQVWSAIDALAERHRLSASGLARKAGLDPTAFNKSKRVSADGRARWPSTESLAKILDATGDTVDEFMNLLGSSSGSGNTMRVRVIGFAQAGSGGYFDALGTPIGQGWDEIDFPGFMQDEVYALEISGDSMEPLYRDGDYILVSPSAQIRKGDRVVVRTTEGEVMAKELRRRSASGIELTSVNPLHPPRQLSNAEIAWMARVVWASQ